MRSLIRVLALLLVGVALIGCISTTTNTGLSKGKPGHDIHGIDAAGKPFQLSDYHGKVVLLDFWSTSCGYCRSMFPHERSLVRKYKGKPFVILGVNSDDSIETLRKTQDKYDLNWRSWWDGGGHINAQWKITGLPTLFLIDRKGMIRWESPGVPDLKQMDDLIEQLVEEANSSDKASAMALPTGRASKE